MAKRDLIGAVFRRPVEMFELINNSSTFHREQKEGFMGAPTFPDRMQLHDLVIAQVANEPVTYLEFGVWKGESFRHWLAKHGNTSSRFAGFDCFMGLPENWTPETPAGTFSTEGKPPEIHDARGRFVVGLFQETLYGYLDETPPTGRLVVHVDCDLYSSTLFVLTTIDRFLRPGSILIFDDFHSLNHEYRAWLDYQRGFPHKWKPLGRTDHGHQAAFELI